MECSSKLQVEYPCRVPIKVIGHEAVLRPDLIAALILKHLGTQPEGDLTHQSNRRGAYISYTFWVTLPDENAEAPLRQAIQALPGVVMQL
jgi:putative lipoic acid-binding regulatory protein